MLVDCWPLNDTSSIPPFPEFDVVVSYQPQERTMLEEMATDQNQYHAIASHFPVRSEFVLESAPMQTQGTSSEPHMRVMNHSLTVPAGAWHYREKIETWQVGSLSRLSSVIIDNSKWKELV
jgi:hypothetical protein